MYYFSLYYVFFIVLVLNCRNSAASQCNGGSVLRSQLYGGGADDFVTSVYLDNNGLLKLAGQTSDGAWTGGSAGYPPDCWVAVIDSAGNERFSLFNIGQDEMYGADLSSENLCIAGMSDALDTIAVWRNGTDNLTAAPTWNSSGSGTNFDSAQGVVCTAQYAYLVSNIDFSTLGDGFTDVVLKQYTIDGSFVRNTTWGGSGIDSAKDAAMKSDVLVIAGDTTSANFPVSSGAFQTTIGPGRDAFILAINVTTGATIFSTYYGGNGEDYTRAVAMDNNGYIYVCGQTSSNDLVLPNAYNSPSGGIADSWLAVWSPQGTLVFASLFGSNGNDLAFDVAVLTAFDGGHLIYLAGSTDGSDFPTFENFSTTTGAEDAYILTYRLFNDYTVPGELLFSTRFGGSGSDIANSISVKEDGRIAIAGATQSADYPANGTYQGGKDAFFTIFNCAGIIPVPPSPSPSPSSSPASTAPVCQSADGCYQAAELAVQFTESADGGYVPSQVIYPASTDGQINTDTSLAVNYHRLEERDPNGNVVSQEEFPTTGYQLSVTSEDIGGTPVQVVQFSNTLASGTNITILNYLFDQETTFDFASTSFPVPKSSTKSNIRIQGWPFQSTENTFHMHIDLGIYPPPQPPVSSVAGDITQYSFQTGVSSCEVSVLDLVEVDSGTATVSSSVSENKIQVNMPYFDDYILYDPGYTVLVQNDQQSSPKEKEPVSQWYYIGAAIGVAVIAAIIAGFLLTFMKNKRRRQRAKSRAAIQHATEQMNSTYSASEVSTV